MQILNNSTQKMVNISRVLQILWHSETETRAGLSRHLNLYRSTTSNIINNLVSKNFVTEIFEGDATTHGGRKPVYLSINKDFGCIIGIELQPTRVYISVINMLGEPIYTNTKQINEVDFQKNLISLLKEIDSVLQEKSFHAIGLCFGIPGIVDPQNKVIINSKPLSLTNFTLKTFFNKYFNVPVLIENDARCLTWLQLTKHRKLKNQDYMVIMAKHHSNGIAVGLSFTFDNKVYYGKHFSSGEFIANSWRPGMTGQFNISEEEQLTIIDDISIYKKWVKDFFETLTPTISMLAPDYLFIHGQPSERKDYIMELLEKEVPQFLQIIQNVDCKLCFSPNDEYEIATGAASMFLQKLFTVPDVAEIDSPPLWFDWESLFELRNNKSIFKC